MADEISQYKRKVRLTRANQLTHKYRAIAARKRQTSRCPPKLKRLQDDPLNLATGASIGRPKGKKEKLVKKKYFYLLSYKLYV